MSCDHDPTKCGSSTREKHGFYITRCTWCGDVIHVVPTHCHVCGCHKTSFHHNNNCKEGQTVELKPGMKVKVEYETTLESRIGGGVMLSYQPSRHLSEDGENLFPSERVHKFTVTPIEETYEVTVKVTGVGFTEEEAQRAVSASLPRTIRWPYAKTGFVAQTKVQGVKD